MKISLLDTQDKYELGRQNFKTITQKFSDKRVYEKALRQANKKYDLKNFKVNNVTYVKAVKIYPCLIDKYKEGLAQEESWLENQRRLFLWLILCFMHIEGKEISDLSEKDILLFSAIFDSKDPSFLKFQIYSMKKNKEKWSTQEDRILLNIINRKPQQEKDWNQISKQFFKQSGFEYFRSSKQCRERFMNHLDENKIKGQWTKTQDLTLMTAVLERGKKWSQISHLLNNCKTEHQVKNRFNSLISKQSKKAPSKDEKKLIKMIVKDTIDSHPSVKSQESQVKLQQREEDCCKSVKSQNIKEEKPAEQQMQNIFSNNPNSKVKFFVRKAGSLTLSDRGGAHLQEMANPILQQMNSEEEKRNKIFTNPVQVCAHSTGSGLSERSSSYNINFQKAQILPSPMMIGNTVNMTPSMLFFEDNQINNRNNMNSFYGSEFSMSLGSNFGRFVPDVEESLNEEKNI